MLQMTSRSGRLGLAAAQECGRIGLKAGRRAGAAVMEMSHSAGNIARLRRFIRKED
jgi:hypothetical protein